MTSPTFSFLAARRPLLRGEARIRKARELAEGYAAGSAIRTLAVCADLSYGTTRTLLREAGVTLRDRGGARRARTDAVSAEVSGHGPDNGIACPTGSR